MLCLCGAVVCINLPFVTEVVSRNTSITTVYPVSIEDMVKMALAGREFALGYIGQKELSSVISGCGLSASLLDSEMITHLKDCTPLFSGVNLTFLILCGVSLISIIITGVVDDHESVGRLLTQSSLLALCVVNVITLWGVANFDMLFMNMHTLLFYGGIWEFDAESLLICMYPENFWIAMGAISVVISDILSISTLIIGIILRTSKS